MRLVIRTAYLVVFLGLVVLGCNQNALNTPPLDFGFQPNPQPVQDLRSLASQLDANNRNLHSQLLAQMQELQNKADQLDGDNRELRDALSQSQQQLAQTVKQQQLRASQQQLARQLPAAQPRPPSGVRQGAASQLAKAPAAQELTVSQELNRRIQQLDDNNRDLHARLAQSQQQVKVYQDQANLLQERLATTAGQLKDLQAAGPEEGDNRVQALTASTRRRSGATITANNSIRQELALVNIPGVEVFREEDVVRIEVPADRLFLPQTTQLQPSATPLLDQVATAIATHYPHQRVGIEGHTDSSPVVGGPSTSHHQLAAARAMAIFEQFTRRNRLPANQMFTLAQGANHPRVSNATPAGRAKNRRIELVIYPESVRAQ